MHITEQHLQRAGMTGNEAKVYLLLLKEGMHNANSAAKRTHIDRSLVYTVLNNLIHKGLVTSTHKKEKKYFEVTPPENLLNNIKEQEAYLKELIPQLHTLQKIEPTDFQVTGYEGKKGIRSFLQYIIKEKHVSCFGATGKLFDLLYGLPTIVQKQMREVNIRAILSPTSHHSATFKKLNIQTRFLATDNKATTCICGDKISIHLAKEEPILIMITNKEIATTYQEHFELLWKTAKPN